MNISSSSSSSPSKLATQMSSDDSSKDDEFDWDSYLIETGSEAAPASHFRQALIPPKNEFNIGDKLETTDPRNQGSWCIGTIIEKDGPRLRLRLDGTDDRNDFWRLVDSGDIRCYGKTAESGGQIVPPLGFQQNSTRWAKYFEKNVKQGPFAADSCFKPQPVKPERNFFKRGQKLEAVDPKHPNVICPATVNNVSSGDSRITLSLDGWSSSNNFKIEYFSRDIFPVGWCQSAGLRLNKVGGNVPSRSSMKTLSTTPMKSGGNGRSSSSVATTKKVLASPISNDSSYSPTTMDEKNNNYVPKQKFSKTSMNKKEQRNSTDFDQTNTNNVPKERPTVIVYLNYTGDNSGIILNPQKFRSSMPSIFGPAEFSAVLTSIFDACIKCAFQPISFIHRIEDLFPTPNEDKRSSYTSIKLENGTMIYIPHLETSEQFWDVIRSFQNAILAGHDLFIATPPALNNQSNGSSSSFLDLSTSPDKRESSPVHRSSNNHQSKRKSTEIMSYSDEKTFVSNGKVARANSHERSAYDTKPSLNLSAQISKPINPIHNGGTTRRPERYTPSDVAAFIRGIDPSFEHLAARFLQEEIDGKALLLLTTDTLMRHMGLKLGPSLKIVHHIDQLKKS